jgi:hypothetical protein
VSCLVNGFERVRRRTITDRAWSRFTRCLSPGRRLRWRYPAGGYLLYRGLSVPTIDWDYPVGISLPGNEITETLDNWPVTLGEIFYGMRGFGPLGIEDDAASPDVVGVTIAGLRGSGIAVPNPPAAIKVKPAAGGQVTITLLIDQVTTASMAAGDVAVPAAWATLYGDGGLGGGVDWLTPIGANEPVTGKQLTFTRDPELPHGTTLVVGVRLASKIGAQEKNTQTRTVVIDSEGPPVMSAFYVGASCE